MHWGRQHYDQHCGMHNRVRKKEIPNQLHWYPNQTGQIEKGTLAGFNRKTQ